MGKVKIYFESGQLRIRVPEEESNERQKFFYALFPIERDWVEEEKYVQYVVNESSWKLVIRIAKMESHRNFVELSQEVDDYYQYQLQADRERAERELINEQRKKAIEIADNRQHYGCGVCPHLEYVNAHWQETNGEKVWICGTHYCKYAMEKCRYNPFDVEYAFEYYKESRYYNPPPGYNPPAFVAKPYPCAGCEYLERANRAWEEINKEKEENGKI